MLLKHKTIAGALTAGLVLVTAAPAFAMDNAMMTASTSAMAGSSSTMMGLGGDEVSTLQTFLVTGGFLDASLPHGHFGALTKAALMKYQASVGLPSTGFYGPLTMAKVKGGASMMTSGSTGSMTAMVPTTDTKAAGLRVLLSVLEHQHVDLASAAVRAGFDGAPSFAAAAAALDANSVAISNAVGSVYGDAAGAQFLAIWRSHITFFVNYTVAAKKGDQAGMTKAVADLGGYVDAVSDFFSSANPNLPRDAVHQLVSAHVGLLKAAVDTYGAADYTGSYKAQGDAYTQIGSISDAISAAIVKQHPEKF
jgi:peptidoglycan hydrolase-like protein with peptidoglycan-binding domain